jgi:putative ABC transport system permease protein
MVTSIIVRSRELAMLETVGMTGVQQKRKLMKEGFAYFLWTVVVSVVISAIMSFTVIRFIIIIPVIAHNRLSKRSVIDRLRVE